MWQSHDRWWIITTSCFRWRLGTSYQKNELNSYKKKSVTKILFAVTKISHKKITVTPKRPRPNSKVRPKKSSSLSSSPQAKGWPRGAVAGRRLVGLQLRRVQSRRRSRWTGSSESLDGVVGVAGRGCSAASMEKGFLEPFG